MLSLLKKMRFIIKKTLNSFYWSRLDILITIKIFLHFFSPSTKMSGKSITFDDKKINKSNFYRNKELFNIHDLDLVKY